MTIKSDISLENFEAWSGGKAHLTESSMKENVVSWNLYWKICTLMA